MSKAGDDGGGADGQSESSKLVDKDAAGGKVQSQLSAASARSDWTKVKCPCCMSERVEPLVLVKLGEKVSPETKRWIIRLIGTPQKEGGEGSIFGVFVKLTFPLTCLQKSHTAD